jgi:hypothetical protein
MKDRHCETCGGLLAATYERTDYYFYIDESGKVVRDTNPDLWVQAALNIHCSNDRTHNIGPIYGEKGYEEFEEWKEQFEREIFKLILEENKIHDV